MARSNTGSTSNWLSNASAPVTGYPCSLALWFYAANITSTQSLLNIDDGTGNNYISLGIDGNNEYGFSDQVILDPSSSVSFAAGSGSTYSANAWNHAAGVAASTTSRVAYLNGSAGTTDTDTAITPSGWDTTTLAGFRVGSSTFGPLNGRIAEAAVWNVALTAAEILSLSKGFCPLLVRRSALVAYWPLIGRMASPEQDRRGNFHLTVNGTMAQAEHPPRIFYPQGIQLGRHTDAAPPGGGNRRRRLLIGGVAA